MEFSRASSSETRRGIFLNSSLPLVRCHKAPETSEAWHLRLTEQGGEDVTKSPNQCERIGVEETKPTAKHSTVKQRSSHCSNPTVASWRLEEYSSTDTKVTVPTSVTPLTHTWQPRCASVHVCASVWLCVCKREGKRERSYKTEEKRWGRWLRCWKERGWRGKSKRVTTIYNLTVSSACVLTRTLNESYTSSRNTVRI